MLGRLKFEIDELVNEMLDQLPEEVFKSKTTTFLDPCMGGGQFVKEVEARLRKYGHSDANIAKRVFGVESSDLRVNYAVNKYGLVGQYFVHENYLEYNETMKFDVVIGNPPYQSPTNPSEKLWVTFSNIVIERLLKANGIIAFVTPNAWTKRPQGQRFKNLTKHFEEHQLLYVNVDCTKHFKIGESIGAWIMRKDGSKNSDAVNLQTETEQRKFNYNGYRIPLTDKDFLGISISQKLTDNNLPKLKTVLYKDMKNDAKLDEMIARGDFSEIRSRAYNTPVYYTPSKKYYMPVDSVRKTHKIIINLTSYYGSKADKMDTYNPVFDETVGVGINAYGMPCKSFAEANRIKSYLFSKLYRFYVEFNRSSNFNLHVRDLPLLESRTWTDEELYKHFKLTKAEIKYIEDNVK